MEKGLLIFVPEVTPRISYIFDLFFNSLIPVEYKLTTSTEEYAAYNGPRFNYSGKKFDNDKLYVSPVGLLSDKRIKQQDIHVSEWQGVKIFYQVENSNLPFDVFAASFYLVSRYEEYLSASYDEHRRFKVTESLAFKNGFLDIPIVNAWAEELKKILLSEYPELKIEERKYSFVSTIDIDVAYAHLGRKAGVTVGSSLKLLSKFNLGGIAHKMAVLSGMKKDEYDTYQYQEDIFKNNKITPIYFFLAGNRSTFDKNIATDSKVFKALIKRMSSVGEVGIHPSYQSASNSTLVKKEVNRVEKNLNKKITKSRQHYLRIRLPETYRCLAELGITDDYSLAYAAAPGFRAGICTPFYFYDLLAEQVLPVKVHSTVVMDGTFNEYLNTTPEEAIGTIKKLILQVKKYKGEFVGIWHNHSLNEEKEWKGWRRVFEVMIEEGKA